MDSRSLLLATGLLLLACSGEQSKRPQTDAAEVDGPASLHQADGPASLAEDRPASLIDVRADGGAGMDSTPRASVRDPAGVRTVTMTGVPSFIRGSVRMLQADLARASDGRFDLAALVMSRGSACTNRSCDLTPKTPVNLHLSAEQTAQVETWLAQIPGVACHSDPGTACDYDAVFAIGIDGPLLPQTCCYSNSWRQDYEVRALYRYLEALAVALVDGGADGGVDASAVDARTDALATDAR